MRTTYKIIQNLRELDELILYCKQSGYCSFDFETTTVNVNYHKFYPTILGISFQPGSAWIIPLGHKDSPLKPLWKKALKKFAMEVLENPSIVKIAWNAMFDGKVLLHYGYRVRGRYMDGMLAKYILKEERPNDLKSMVALFLPEFADYDLEGKPGKKASPETIHNFWSNVPLETLSKYCAGDADFTLRIFLHLENKLMEHGMYHLLRNFYMPLVRILTQTVLNGVKTDRVYLKDLMVYYYDLIEKTRKSLYNIPIIREYGDIIQEDRLEVYIKNLEDEIESGDLSPTSVERREEKISRLEAGEPTTKKEEKLFEPINFASTQQMVELLYDHDDGFYFPILGRTKTGNPSTGEDILLKLKPQDDTGFIKNLLELRGLEKLYSTYVKAMWVDHLTIKDTIHPGYLLHGTVSGRTSSRGPNFQNIPRSSTAEPIKKMFIAPKDHFFVEIDASQAELRIAAELSGDRAMQQVFKDGKNIHVATAEKIFKVDYDLINKARKDDSHPDHPNMVKKHKAAKVLNFTIFYGAGPKKVSEFITESTGEFHSQDQAKVFIRKWFEAYPQAAKWISRTQENVQREGFVESPIGRKRRLPILLDKRNAKLEMGKYNEALRQCVDIKTEALCKKRGWVTYNQLNLGDAILAFNLNGNYYWEEVEEMNIYPDYTGPMYLFENGRKSISALTTPEHNWPRYTRHGYGEWKTSEELAGKQQVNIPRAANYKAVSDIVYPDDLVELIGWVLTDGSMCYYNTPLKPRHGKPRKISITQSFVANPQKHRQIELLLNRLGYKYNIRDVGGSSWFGLEKRAADDLHKIIPHKEISMEFLLNLTYKQLRLLIKTIQLGDGIRVTTVNKNHRDMFQILGVLAGFSVNYTIRDGNVGVFHKSDKLVNQTGIIKKQPSYGVNFLKRNIIHNKGSRGGHYFKHIENYRGLVWCPTVASGAWVCRRAGTQYITGNSVNARIQGYASDITQWLNILVYKAILKGELPSYLHLVSTVHDSIEFYVHKKDIHEVVQTITSLGFELTDMRKYLKGSMTKVDMKFSSEVGITWGRTHSYNPNIDYVKFYGTEWAAYNKEELLNHSDYS